MVSGGRAVASWFMPAPGDVEAVSGKLRAVYVQGAAGRLPSVISGALGLPDGPITPPGATPDSERVLTDKPLELVAVLDDLVVRLEATGDPYRSPWMREARHDIADSDFGGNMEVLRACGVMGSFNAPIIGQSVASGLVRRCRRAERPPAAPALRSLRPARLAKQEVTATG